MTTPRELADKIAPVMPSMSLIWTAVVDVGSRQSLGTTPNGERFIVPILGGEFFDTEGKSGLNGKIVAGGADRQLVTPSGLKHLEAIYEMETDDGTILSIENRVTIDETSQPEPYRLSVIKVIAPKGPFEWLNRRVFLGTLQTAQPERNAVIIRGWGQL